MPLLPPGTYEFQLPVNLSAKHWEETEQKQDGKVVAKWHRVKWSADLPLVVVRDTTAEQSYNGQLFEGGCSTQPRPRYVGKKGDPPKHVSDAAYLYKDGLKGNDRTFKPTESEKLVAAICKIAQERAQAGKPATFLANVTWPGNCSKKKVRYVLDSNGQSIEDPEKKMGCGKFHRVAPAERFQCECGAAIRVFPELENYRASE